MKPLDEEINAMPSVDELSCLLRILRKATHRNVADALLKGFLWAVWPGWYEHYKYEFGKSKGLDNSPAAK